MSTRQQQYNSRRRFSLLMHKNEFNQRQNFRWLVIALSSSLFSHINSIPFLLPFCKWTTLTDSPQKAFYTYIYMTDFDTYAWNRERVRLFFRLFASFQKRHKQCVSKLRLHEQIFIHTHMESRRKERQILIRNRVFSIGLPHVAFLLYDWISICDYNRSNNGFLHMSKVCHVWKNVR